MNDLYRQYLLDGERAGARYALSPQRKAPFGLAGARIANRAGSSLEFMEHREYQVGDDLRRIDWNVYARTDKLNIKLFQEEVNPHLDIVIDGSRSMALSAKAQATLGLAAVFVQAASNIGFTHCAWITHQGCRRVANGSDRPSAWDEIDFDQPDNPAEAFIHMPPAWRPHGVRVLLSDLLWLTDPLITLSQLADKAVEVVVVQVLADSDVNPPQRGNIRLVDSETGQVQEIFLDAPAEHRYRAALARHQQNWHRAARQVGAVMTTVVAERIVGDWNLDELVAAEVLEVA